MDKYSNDIPAGDYTCEIVDMNVIVDKKGRRVVEWRLRIVGGACAGQMITKRYYLENENGKAFLKKELNLLGISATNEAQFESQKRAVYGKMVKITVVINEHGYPVYYLKGLQGNGDYGSGQPAALSW